MAQLQGLSDGSDLIDEHAFHGATVTG
jgi:hypothetical protein